MSLKDWIKHSPLYAWKYRYSDRRVGPIILRERGRLLPGDGPATFVVICGAQFDQATPNAATTCRMGWCRGFEQIGIPYVLVSAFDLAKRIQDIPNPICWITGSDYLYLDKENLRALKNYPHVAWVSTYFDGDADYFRRNGFPNMSWNAPLRRRILSSEPNFLFTLSAESRFGFYEGWLREGARLVSLPLACDVQTYANPRALSKFNDVEIAFVGGYWPYKARQFDIYLKPLERHLRLFGYSPWPYGNYGGQLPEDEEGSLYSQARVSPVVNEPHVAAMSIDINERVFKVLGAGGLAVTDATEGYRDWFSPDELLVPSSPKQYRELISEILDAPESYTQIRESGRRAVLERHTYAHRAESLCRLLDIALQYSSISGGRA